MVIDTDMNCDQSKWVERWGLPNPGILTHGRSVQTTKRRCIYWLWSSVWERRSIRSSHTLPSCFNPSDVTGTQGIRVWLTEACWLHCHLWVSMEDSLKPLNKKCLLTKNSSASSIGDASEWRWAPWCHAQTRDWPLCSQNSERLRITSVSKRKGA